MSKPTVEPGGSPGLTSQIEVLREVLRDPRPPDLGDAAAVAHPESLLEPYLGQFFEGTAVIAPDGRFRLFTAGLEHITGRPAQEVGSLKVVVQRE